ncbi:methyltransferase domain-containing protein [uncultured Tateyamaria sp.]|uniref:class I SAM-dependent methyltransferase n=1 Tax=uncultured Tateyamaria sp. TaxID=455651 RepID=UPI0026226B02|nr:methyltransferase domain-containing protein [uncultured Tateyamaria sp.]
MNHDQEEFWDASAGPAWVALQGQMDALIQPVLDLVLERAGLRPGERVLDIGCGTGASVLQALDQVGDRGHVTGVDIAASMLELAKGRLGGRANVDLLKSDAQTHVFTTDYDALISRFGVMFFADTTAAFANMARALAPGGRIICAAWGPAPHNPWFMEPAGAAADVLGSMPKVDRTEPGPFAFEDAARTCALLQAAGLEDIQATQIDLHLTPLGDLSQAADLCCQIGPADRALRHHEANPAQRRAVADRIAARFAQYQEGDNLRIPASINLFTARKST